MEQVAHVEQMGQMGQMEQDRQRKKAVDAVFPVHAVPLCRPEIRPGLPVFSVSIGKRPSVSGKRGFLSCPVTGGTNREYATGKREAGRGKAKGGIPKAVSQKQYLKGDISKVTSQKRHLKSDIFMLPLAANGKRRFP